MLPRDLFPKNSPPIGSVIYCDYAAKMSTFKGRSILQSNAISLVLQGEKTIQFADKTLEISDYAFYFLSAGNCLTTIDLTRQDTFRSIMIFFEDRVLSGFLEKYGAKTGEGSKKKPVGTEPCLKITKDDFVNSYIASLSFLLKSKRKMSEEMKLLKLEELMLYLLERYPDLLLSFRNGENREDLDIRRVSESNATRNISISELSFLCSVSLSTFKRRFIKIYGVPPQKWFLQRKMEMASKLLQYHKVKPSEIFHKVGYENHSSFSQTFKTHFGMTPSEFRLNYT